MDSFESFSILGTLLDIRVLIDSHRNPENPEICLQACQQHDPMVGGAHWPAVRQPLKDIDAKALNAESPLVYVSDSSILLSAFPK